MAQLLAPSGLELIKEGMKKALGRAATSGEQVRALDNWLPEIKSDIWGNEGGSHRLLESEVLILLTEGTTTYSLPSDFDSLKSASILDGDVRDTCQPKISGAYTGSGISVNSDNLQDGNLNTSGWNQAALVAGSFIRFNLNAPNNFTKVKVYMQGTGLPVTYSVGYSSTGGSLGNYTALSDTLTVGTDESWHELEWSSVGTWQYWALIVNGVPSGAGNITEVEWLTSTSPDGVATTIRLASSDSSQAEGRVGKEIVIIGGTGAGQKRQITAFDTTTKIATVHSAWSILPDNTTQYLIVNKYIPIRLMDPQTFAQITNRTKRERPKAGMVWNNQLHVQRSPDKVYPLVYFYWINILKVDVADTNTTHQQILTNWRNLFVEGIFMKTLQNDDDLRANTEQVVYQEMLSKITHKANRIGYVTPHDF